MRAAPPSRKGRGDVRMVGAAAAVPWQMLADPQVREIARFLHPTDLGILECGGRDFLRDLAPACWRDARRACTQGALDILPGKLFFAARARTRRLVPASFEETLADADESVGGLESLCFTLCVAWSGKITEELVVFEHLRSTPDAADGGREIEVTLAVPADAPGQAPIAPWLVESLKPTAPPRADGRITFDQLEIHEKWCAAPASPVSFRPRGGRHTSRCVLLERPPE